MIPSRYNYGKTCGFSFFSSLKTSQELLLNYESRNMQSRQLCFKKHFDDRKICTTKSCQRHSTDLRRHFNVKTCAFGLFAIEKLSKKSREFIVTESRKRGNSSANNTSNDTKTAKLFLTEYNHLYPGARKFTIQTISGSFSIWISVKKIFFNFC